jgi:bifunctional NMN adenylyltransferase/nudix hydrolase
MNYEHEQIVFVGRCNPPTKAHILIINKALELGDQVVVLLGSSYQARTIKNPWSHSERSAMIMNSIPVINHPRLKIIPIRDFANNEHWVSQVQSVIPKNKITKLIGHKKDISTTFYLEMFPQWAPLIDVGMIEDINATDVRNQYFDGTLFNWKDKEILPETVMNYLKEWKKTPNYDNLVAQYKQNLLYKESWKQAPYAPTFLTTDALVIQSGHVLLIQRKAEPGKGLWALPGGFVNQNERILDGCIRELYEETKIKISRGLLLGSKVASDYFDKPDRSLRGRTVTHVFKFVLPNGPLTKVKGNDDAAKAKWFPISEVLEMEELMFEDHFQIIGSML